MKLRLIAFIQIHNFMIASVTGGMCPETLQECLNCKAAASCAPYREIRTAVSKDNCKALLENAGNTMVEYETGPGICKAFNCQYREEAQGFSAVIISCRTDCPQYIIQSRIQQSGSCDVTSQFATSSGLACLQFCLHRDGCMGVTHQVYPNDVNICTFHTCSSSVFESMYSSTFVGINCTAVQEWTSMRESSDVRRLPTTTGHLNTSSNAGAVLFTTISSRAVSSVVGSVVTVLVSNC